VCENIHTLTANKTTDPLSPLDGRLISIMLIHKYYNSFGLKHTRTHSLCYFKYLLIYIVKGAIN